MYQWEIVSLDGAAGEAGGRDLLQIQGDLNIAADAGGFTIRLETTETLAGWDNTSSHTWTIATVVGSILGGDPLAATIDAAGFAARHELGGGWFGLQLAGTDINLVFTAIPEPSALHFSVCALLAASALRFRSRRRDRVIRSA